MNDDEGSALTEAIESTLKHVSRTFSKVQITEWLDTYDEYGICLIHYIVALDLDSAI